MQLALSVIVIIEPTFCHPTQVEHTNQNRFRKRARARRHAIAVVKILLLLGSGPFASLSLSKSSPSYPFILFYCLRLRGVCLHAPRLSCLVAHRLCEGSAAPKAITTPSLSPPTTPNTSPPLTPFHVFPHVSHSHFFTQSRMRRRRRARRPPRGGVTSAHTRHAHAAVSGGHPQSSSSAHIHTLSSALFVLHISIRSFVVGTYFVTRSLIVREEGSRRRPTPPFLSEGRARAVFAFLRRSSFSSPHTRAMYMTSRAQAASLGLCNPPGQGRRGTGTFPASSRQTPPMAADVPLCHFPCFLICC
mmetsp:Transcript_8344/g.23961  ORF Transcript_8344/g.23961 Transcript_8344/m.23961 type:complete len:303 (+) Transcript_8344:77-985(+)